MPYDTVTGDWYDDNDPEQDHQQQQQQPEPRWRKKLEEQAKAGKEALERAQQLEAEKLAAQRELAFLRAGINVDAGPGKLFAKAYDGELSVDAVKTAATEYGVLQPEKPKVSADEMAANARMAGASAGAPPRDDQSDWRSDLMEIPEIVDGQWNPDAQNKVLELVRKHGGQIGKGAVTKWSSDGGSTWSGAPAVGSATEMP